MCSEPELEYPVQGEHLRGGGGGRGRGRGEQGVAREGHRGEFLFYKFCNFSNYEYPTFPALVLI